MNLDDRKQEKDEQVYERLPVKEKSLGINMVMYSIKTISTVLFPFISYSYASHILNVDSIGKVEFSHSIISYFTLFAGLGINTFTIRSGSKYKDDKEAFASFANRALSIVLLSTVLSYVVLFALMAIVPRFAQIKTLLLIQSFMISLTTFGIEWLYVIYEKYAYIAIRSLSFQTIGLFFLFVFVKQPSDYMLYAIIVMLATYGPCCINFVQSKSYFRKKLIYDKVSLDYLKEISVMFFFSLTSTIYVNSDSTMIGFLSGDYFVGLYSVATKIYTAFKVFLSTVMNVSLTRLSFYFALDRIEKYHNTVSMLMNILIIIVFPLMIGICCLAKPLVFVIGGAKFAEAEPALIILSGTLLFATAGMMINCTILLPQKKEKYILLATSIGAIANIVLNLFMIPMFQHVGAAWTTLISETIVMVIQCYAGRSTLKALAIDVKSTLIPSLIECFIIIIVYICVSMVTTLAMPAIILTFCLSIIAYLVLLLAFKNAMILSLREKIPVRIRKLK